MDSQKEINTMITFLHHLSKFLIVVYLMLFSSISWAENKCTSVKYSAPSGVQNDIEFILDKPYVCGQFANGDWWVSGNNSDVTITDITPSIDNGLNGFEVNPTSNHEQAFDRRISGYNKKLVPTLPLKLTSRTSSVVKTVSVPTQKKKCRPCIQYAAVLTIVPKAISISVNVLRPGYFGATKIIHRLEDINLQSIGKWPARHVTKKKKHSFKALALEYQGVRLDHIVGWVGRPLHPKDNMPEYGAQIALDNSITILRMLLDDFNVENRYHKATLVNYLQMAVDLRSMADGGVIWPANGGHGNGRKLPLLFAAQVLNDDGFNNAVYKSRFSEDEQVYFSQVNGRALYGRKCSVADYWLRYRMGKGKRTCRDPYGFIDGGGKEIGEAYQKCCTAKPWKYTALAIEMLDLKRKWNHDAFFQYIDRWVEHGTWASPDPCASYNNNPNDGGKHWGGSPTCVKGNGRSIDKHGTNKDSGHYGSSFGDEMWQRYKFKILRN